MIGGRAETIRDERVFAAARNLQTARQRYATELGHRRIGSLPPQLVLVHVKDFAGIGDSIKPAHQRLLGAFPSDQVQEVAVSSLPYLGHRGKVHNLPVTDHYAPYSFSPEIVLTGGAFGICHYYYFRSWVDQQAEIAHLLHRKVDLNVALIGDAIYCFRLLAGKVDGSVNLHEARGKLSGSEYAQLEKSLASYQQVGRELKPEYSLPLQFKISRTAGHYLRTR
jgi:hypothetical protein